MVVKHALGFKRTGYIKISLFLYQKKETYLMIRSKSPRKTFINGLGWLVITKLLGSGRVRLGSSQVGRLNNKSDFR